MNDRSDKCEGKRELKKRKMINIKSPNSIKKKRDTEYKTFRYIDI